MPACRKGAKRDRAAEDLDYVTMNPITKRRHLSHVRMYVFAFMTDTGNVSLTLTLMSTYNSSVVILDFRKSLREAVELCLKYE